MFENVAGIKHHDKGKTLRTILESLQESGEYNIHHEVLNTEDHGIPQNRPRLYIIGIKKNDDKGSFSWPEKIGSCNTELLLDSRNQILACTGEVN